MANPLHSDVSPAKRPSNATQKRPEPGTPKGSTPAMKVDGPKWGGLPGKTQPKDRSRGVPRAKTSVKRMGL